jgi:UV DNA damage endonuclease
MSEYEIEKLPRFKEIEDLLLECGELSKKNDQRLTFHPGPFVVLASPHEWVRKKARRELEQHSQILDLMGFKPSTWNKINIHIGGAYGDKTLALDRWKRDWELLNESTRARLVVENDDKASMYSVKDLHENIYSSIGVPITFDSFHHDFCTGGLEKPEAAALAASTWKKDPVFHHASSMKLHENESSVQTAHSEWIYEELTNWGTGAWIMVECKAKDLAIFNYKSFGPGKPHLNSLSEDLKNTYSKFSHV